MIRNPICKSAQAAVLAPLLFFALACVPSAGAQTMVQVPFASDYFGVPASTPTGNQSQACTSTNPNYLDYFGDGCSAIQATINEPLDTAIDAYNNIYVADYADNLVRVVYQGGPVLAATLIAATPNYAFTPTVGSVYPFGGLTGNLASHGGVYYCNGTSGAAALDKVGDGCPAQESYITPRAVGIDSYGDIFVGNTQPYQSIHVIYAGGPAAAKLITGYNPSITAPQIGCIYQISASGDFVYIRDIFIDANENVYVADSGNQATASTGLQAATTGNQVKKFTGTGWATFVLGLSLSAAANPTPNAADGDGTIPSATVAMVDGPCLLYVDANGNVYIADQLNTRIRVVYAGGTTPPLYIEGANSTVITTPTVGAIYTVAGGGTLHSAPNLASAINVSKVGNFGFDSSGNLYFLDSSSKYIWREDWRTGNTVVIGANGSSYTTGYSTTASAAAGVPCNGSSGGPVMTDAYADGCPATEVTSYNPVGRVLFDSAGNFYFGEERYSGSSASPVAIIRKYTFANQLGSVAIGSSASVSIAFTPVATGTSLTPSQTYVITGDSTSEFIDAGSDLCSVSTSNQTCVYNVTFRPTMAGAREGALTLSAAGSNLVSAPLQGIGLGAQLTLDPGTRTVIGSGLAPSGAGVDQGGNFYVADATSGNLYKSAAGTALTLVSSGYKNASQIAVDNSGNVFVADTGNNRIAVAVNSALPSAELNSISALSLSAPSGVATDLAGNLYIADTGNNRVLMVTPLGGSMVKGFSGLSSPHGLAVDYAGDIFVADTGNARIVELLAPASPGVASVQTIAAVSPALIAPIGVAVDPAGDLYIADATNQNIVAVSTGSTTATTLYGDVTSLTGLAVDTTGDLLVSATSLPGLLELNRTKITYNFPETNVGSTSTQVLTVNSTGNTSLVLGANLGVGTDTTDFSTGTTSGSSSCSTAQSLMPGQNCGILATFKPQSKAAFQSNITFTSSNATDSASALLVGTGVQETASTISLNYTTSTGGQPLAGQPFTLTASINPSAATGTVIFAIDDNAYPAMTIAGGSATLTNVTLAAGSHTATCVYSGDSTYAGSACSVTFTVVTPTTTSLSFVTNPAPYPGANNPFTVVATVAPAPSQGSTLGTVTFTITGQTPQTVTVSGGTVTSGNFSLPTGKYPISICYSGTAYYVASCTSGTVQVVPAGIVAMKLTVTSPTGTITFGQSVTVNDASSYSNGGGSVPTGTVTFSVGTTSQPPVSYGTSLNATISGLGAGNYTVMACYSGDNSYQPGCTTLAITINRYTPTGTLTIAPNVSATGNSFVITAALSSALGISPTGTATVTAPGLTYGPGALAQTVPSTSSVTFNTKTNVFPSYCFNASYSGDANYLPLMFQSCPSPTFQTALQASAVSIPQYGTAIDFISVNAFFGYSSSNIQITCSGLPADSICRSSPSVDMVAQDSSTSVQLQVFTAVNPNSASMERGPLDRRLLPRATTAALCLLLIVPVGRYRRRFQKPLTALMFSLLMLMVLVGFSGCGSDTSVNPVLNTPTGTFPITVTATDGTITTSVVLTLTVTPGTPAARP